MLASLAPLATVLAAISPVLVSGFFARRSAVRDGFYGQDGRS